MYGIYNNGNHINLGLIRTTALSHTLEDWTSLTGSLMTSLTCSTTLEGSVVFVESADCALNLYKSVTVLPGE